MTMITPSYLGETIEYSSLHACRSTLEDPTSEEFGGGVPFVRIHENQVDVGAVIQFTAAEFAQRDYGEFGSLGRSPLVRKFTPDGLPRGIHDGVGQIGKVFGSFRYVGVLQDIAKQYPKQLPAAEQRQIDGSGSTLCGQRARQQLLILFGEKTAMKIARGRDLDEPFRKAYYGVGEKVAERENRQGITKRGGIFRNAARGLGSLLRQPIEEMYCIVRIGQRWQQRGYAADRSRRKFSEVNKFRSRTNRVAELDLFVETQHYLTL